MQYNLGNNYQRECFRRRCEQLLAKGSFVDLTEKSFRTSSQNSYLHLIIGAVALETGTTLQTAKELYFKQHCNRDLFVREVDDKYCGKVMKIRSSADLSKEEMSLAIDRFKKWASEEGMYLPEPGDEELLKDIAAEMGRNARYLNGNG